MKNFLLALGAGMSLLAYAAPTVEIKTSLGEIVVELDKEKAPKTVENFMSYVDEKFYDGVIFHRVIKDFMIQGGGYDQNFSKKDTKSPIVNEANNGLRNARGTIAMARTNQVNSATSQFFINHKDNDFLDYSSKNAGYAVFGKVVKGMEVVDKIAAVPTGKSKGMDDVPKTPVIIESIREVKEEQ